MYSIKGKQDVTIYCVLFVLFMLSFLHACLCVNSARYLRPMNTSLCYLGSSFYM